MAPHLFAANAERFGDDLDEAAVAQTQLGARKVAAHLASQVLSHQLDNTQMHKVSFFIFPSLILQILRKNEGSSAPNLLLGCQIQVFLRQDVGELGQGSLRGQVSSCDQSGVDQHLDSDRQQRSARCFQTGNIVPDGGLQ